MNDIQKSLIIIGLLLFLFALAHHFLFIQNIKSDLDQVQFDYNLEEFSESAEVEIADSPVIQEDEIVILEGKLRNATILKYFLFFAGVVVFITSYFYREKHHEDEWEYEDWEDDDCEDDSGF